MLMTASGGKAGDRDTTVRLLRLLLVINLLALRY